MTIVRSWALPRRFRSKVTIQEVNILQKLERLHSIIVSSIFPVLRLKWMFFCGRFVRHLTFYKGKGGSRKFPLSLSTCNPLHSTPTPSYYPLSMAPSFFMLN
jgi:hypothetical protein